MDAHADHSLKPLEAFDLAHPARAIQTLDPADAVPLLRYQYRLASGLANAGTAAAAAGERATDGPSGRIQPRFEPWESTPYGAGNTPATMLRLLSAGLRLK